MTYLDLFTGMCICYTQKYQKCDSSTILTFNLCFKLNKQWLDCEIIMLPVFVISNHFHLTSLTGICLHHCAITQLNTWTGIRHIELFNIFLDNVKGPKCQSKTNINLFSMHTIFFYTNHYDRVCKTWFTWSRRIWVCALNGCAIFYKI